MNRTNCTQTRGAKPTHRAWVFEFLKQLNEGIPVGSSNRRHNLSWRTIGRREELVLSIADSDDNWLIYLDDADCGKPVKRAVDDVLKFLRKRQEIEGFITGVAEAARAHVASRAAAKSSSASRSKAA